MWSYQLFETKTWLPVHGIGSTKQFVCNDTGGA